MSGPFVFIGTHHIADGQLVAAGTRFDEAPRNEDYGKVVVFRDLYGNRWDLIEPTSNAS